MEAIAVERPAATGLLLAEGTKLVHIGPHKTGTTALQGAFHLARTQAKEQGVQYAGYGRHSASQVLAVIGRPSPWSDDRKPPDIRTWQRLAAEVRGARAQRVVLSSEYFSEADSDTIRRVVRDLGGEPIHIAVTLRPIARILPSQWQQYVQNRLTEEFDVWLRKLLTQPRGKVSPNFWRRHQHDALIRRWADVVGAENVTAVILDEKDHDFVLRVFEELVGLTSGTLQFDPALVNRSLTLPEIEMVRAFNAIYKAEKMPVPLYTRVLRRGAAALMERRKPAPDEAKVDLPPWSLEPVGQLAREIVDGIAASGVRVVGDLESLTRVSTRREEGSAPYVIKPDVAASLAFGILLATGAARGTARMEPDPEAGPPLQMPSPYSEPPELFRISTLQLGLVLFRRMRGDLRDRIARLVRRR
ncbi:MAG: hypothetical protein FIA92_14385 [Chloroflexi bacterium]|nr:hypothetical protein [Chloroflexota bacterium]